MKTLIASLAILTFVHSGKAGISPKLEPLMVEPDYVVYQSDFSETSPLNNVEYKCRQNTRWTIQDGVLEGRPSNEENQQKKHHRGLEPRLSFPTTPQDFLVRFSIRFLGGEETTIAPFVEFDHHVCRVRFSGKGAELLAQVEKLRVAEAKELPLELGKWYHALAERKGEEFVIQFAEGPTLYAKHASLVKADGDGFGIAGTRGGNVELDNVAIYSVKRETSVTWESTRKKLPVYEPVKIEQSISFEKTSAQLREKPE